MGVWQMPNGGYFNLGYVSANLNNLNYHGPRSVLLIPRAPGVSRSCQMDGHAISTHKGS